MATCQDILEGVSQYALGRGVYPSVHWAGGVYPTMHWAGGCLPGGVCPRGVCLGVSAWGCLPGGVCLGVSAWGGVSIPVPAGIPPPHPVKRITDDCENITLPQLRYGW